MVGYATPPRAAQAPRGQTWARYIAPLHGGITVAHTADQLAELDALLQHSIATAGDFLRLFVSDAGKIAHGCATGPLPGDGSGCGAGDDHSARRAAGGAGGISVLRRTILHTHVVDSTRARHATARPEISLTHYVDIDIAIIAHGVAALVGPAHPDFAASTRTIRPRGFSSCASAVTASTCGSMPERCSPTRAIREPFRRERRVGDARRHCVG